MTSDPAQLARVGDREVQEAFAACVRSGLVLSVVGDEAVARNALSAAWKQLC